MASTFLSRIIGLVRVKYIVWLFGRGVEADAFNAAFVLPDMISYFLVGGAASITFVTILTRYRETGREAEGERSLSVILTTMYLVLGAAIVLAEIFAPWYIHWWFNGFDAEKAALCVKLTRILLPAQLCFFAGGVFGAVLLVRKQFSVQAVAPLIYGLGTIVGGTAAGQAHRRLFAGHRHGGGRVLGPVPAELVSLPGGRALATASILDWHDEGLREWVRLSLPLMVGVSLVTADSWIIGHFASKIGGAVSLMSYAKQLFTAPMAMLAQAAGAASMPFFASLWSRKSATNLPSAWRTRFRAWPLWGCLRPRAWWRWAGPLIDLVFSGGRFSACRCARVRCLFRRLLPLHVSLVGAGHLCARLLRRRQHRPPAIAGTIVTVVSWPIYLAFFHWHGAMGLAIASDIGIALQTVTIAVLLHAAHGFAGQPGLRELGRCLLAALASGAALWLTVWAVDEPAGPHLSGMALASSTPAGPIWWCCWPDLRFGWRRPRLSWKNPDRRCPEWP